MIARPNSMCGRLGSDFYDYSNVHCSGGSAPAGSALLCDDLMKYKEKSKKFGTLYYVWDMEDDDDDAAFQKLSVQVGDGVCHAAKSKERAAQACLEPLDSPAKQQACA